MSEIEVRMSRKGASSLSVGDKGVCGKGKGVGPAIAAAREMQGLSKEMLAERMGISTSELELVEAGEKEADPKMLLKLAEGLQMKMELTFDTEPEVAMVVKFRR